MPLLPGVASKKPMDMERNRMERKSGRRYERNMWNFDDFNDSINKSEIEAEIMEITTKHGDIIRISPGWEYGEEKLTISYSIQN